MRYVQCVKTLQVVEFEVLRAAIMKSSILWDVPENRNLSSSRTASSTTVLAGTRNTAPYLKALSAI
jgi:hypothetical protein